MSKSNHFDHDYHIKRNYSNNENLKIINGYFKEIEYLVYIHNSEKENDCKVILEWIEKMHVHFFDEGFNHLTFSRFFDDLTRILMNHPKIQKRVMKYINENNLLTEDLLKRTEEVLLVASPRELCHILGGIAKLQIEPSPSYMVRWLSASKGKISNFTALDVKQSIRSLARLRVTPSPDWMHEWYIQCDAHMSEIAEKDYVDFSKMLSALAMLQVIPEPRWFKTFIAETHIYLTSLKNVEDVFMASQAFAIEAVNNNDKFVKDWFAHSLEKMEEVHGKEADFVCTALFYTTKLDNDIPLKWLDRCLLKITNEFEFLSLKGISYAMYAVALLQIDVESIRPFLEKCRQAFKRINREYFNSDYNIFEFQRIMISHFYFKLKKYDLELDINQYVELEEVLRKREHKDRSEGEKYVQEILDEVGIYNVSNEHWVGCIMDHVDFYLPSQQKILEFDGGHHYLNGKVNRLTKLKTFILTCYGYNLIRLDYKNSREENKRILLNELSVSKITTDSSIMPQKSAGNARIINLPESLRLFLLKDEVRDKPNEIIYKCWMPEVYQHARKCEIPEFGNFMGQLGLLVCSHKKLKSVVHTHYEENADFREEILKKSMQKVERATSLELLELLHNFERLGIAPDENWIHVWSDNCRVKMHEFTILDFEYAFSYFISLKIKAQPEWKTCWLSSTQNLICKMNQKDVIEFVRWCIRNKVELSDSWVLAWKARVIELFPLMKTEQEILFSLTRVFSIKEVNNDAKFIQNWFTQSESLIEGTRSELLVDAFYQLVKNKIIIPDTWLTIWQQRIMTQFYEFSLEEVSQLIYGLALSKIDILRIKPLLDLIQHYFSKNSSSLNKDVLDDVYHKIMISINYYDIHGYKIIINMKDYEQSYESFFPQETPFSPMKDKLEKYLREGHFYDLQRHVRIDFLLQCVDFYSVAHNLIIEVDRDIKIAKSGLIDAILVCAGYSIIRLSYERIKTLGYVYVEEKIKEYIGCEKTLEIKRDLFKNDHFASTEKTREPVRMLDSETHSTQICVSQMSSNTSVLGTSRILNSIQRHKSKLVKKSKKYEPQRKLNRDIFKAEKLENIRGSSDATV